MRQRLRRQSQGLAADVGDVLDRNLRERHIRGGEATRRKYSAQRT